MCIGSRSAFLLERLLSRGSSCIALGSAPAIAIFFLTEEEDCERDARRCGVDAVDGSLELLAPVFSMGAVSTSG